MRVESVLQPSLHKLWLVLVLSSAQSCPCRQGQCRGSPARASQPGHVCGCHAGHLPSPSPSPAQGWRIAREIKQAISKAERKAAIWALTARSLNDQKEFSSEAREMQ